MSGETKPCGKAIWTLRKATVEHDENDFNHFHQALHQTSIKQQPKQHQPPKQSKILGFVLGSGSFSTSATGALSVCSSVASVTPTDAKTPRPPNQTTVASVRQKFLRQSSSFLRVADLNLHLEDEEENMPSNHNDDASSITMSDDSSFFHKSNTSLFSGAPGGVANFSYASVDPPPGVDHDPDERWIALDDGAGRYAPIAPRAVAALAKIGLESAMFESMWTPHTAARYFKASPWHASTWGNSSPLICNDELPPARSKQEDAVLLWTGKFQHGLYGSELPAVRAVGIIPASPKALFDLLIDSDRVKEYNKLSLGRQDLLVLQDTTSTANPSASSRPETQAEQDHTPFGHEVVTKVMRSTSKPPMVSQMELVSMMHARELDDGSGYLIVTRAVTLPEGDRRGNDNDNPKILLGVNVIKRIQGDPDRSVMINMIHMRSPMVPMIIANRIGASSAANFIKDLRAAFA